MRKSSVLLTLYGTHYDVNEQHFKNVFSNEK